MTVRKDPEADERAGWLSLVDAGRYRAEQNGERLLYTFSKDGEQEQEQLSFARLDLQARAIAARLQEMGMRGQRALLLYPPGLPFISAFFGCLYAGTVAVPVHPPRRPHEWARMEGIGVDSGALAVLTVGELAETVAAGVAMSGPLQHLQVLATDTLGEQEAGRWREHHPSREELAFLQYTSGSTGHPKGVMVSHGNLLHNLEVIHGCFGHTSQSQGVIWLPPYHDMGLIGGMLEPLYSGFPVALMSPLAFLQRPMRWLEAVSRYRGTTSGGPNFAFELVTRKSTPEQREKLDLSSWTVAFNGAEPIRVDVLERFIEAFAPCGFRREALYPCYGLAESTLMVTGVVLSEPPRVHFLDKAALGSNRAVPTAEGVDAVPSMGCGRTWLGQRCVIVDPRTHLPCEPGQIGEIWVGGPSVARGYWGKPEQTRETFEARLAGSDEGPFLRTGDLGALVDGELVVTGRIKDLIIVRGKNYYPQDLELTAQNSHPALRPGGGAAFSLLVDGEERLVMLQEVERTHVRNLETTAVVKAVRKAVVELHELNPHDVVLVMTHTLPKTSSGKIQRYQCRALYLEGGLERVGADAP